MFKALAALSLARVALAQNAGTLTAEKHPQMPFQVCDGAGCKTSKGEVVLDSNWRWLHTKEGYANCYDGNKWVAEHCPDGKACASNCALEGAEYEKVYGITTPKDGALKLQFVTKNGNGANVGSRVYLMESETKYKMFNMLNKEITFDVDVSKLPVC
jgi:cellulose 1,4-beta-cellobiosidase